LGVFSILTDIPRFRLGASGLARDEAFEAWRQIMARLFHIEKSPLAKNLPFGGMSAVFLDDIMLNRSIFSAQQLTRDNRRIGATSDHLVLQLYRSGGFSGEMSGNPVSISRGQIAICDLRQPLDVRAVASDTIGLTVPRHLLKEVDLGRLRARLDPARERILAARMLTLHHRLPALRESEVAAVTADVLAALHVLFDASASAGRLEACEFDADIIKLAERVIAGALKSPDVSPGMIAEQLQVSRAALYRAFAPLGGVMQHVWTVRLQAVKAAIEHPLESRTLTRLATDHGFKTVAHLSRSFRERYGAPPREWRRQQAVGSAELWEIDARRLETHWRELGR
jgi:AraC-like DNA-binding protein